MKPWQNGSHFADDTFKCIFFNENVRISIGISLKFVPKSPIKNIPEGSQLWSMLGNGYWKIQIVQIAYMSLDLNDPIRFQEIALGNFQPTKQPVCKEVEMSPWFKITIIGSRLFCVCVSLPNLLWS